MAISFPQFAVNNGGGTTSITATFASPIAAGSFIAIASVADNGVSSLTFSDSHSDAVTDSGLGLVANGTIGTATKIAALLTPTAGTQSVTVTSNTTAAFLEIVIWEIAGITGPVFDKAVQGTTTGTNSATSASTGTLSASAEAAIGYGISGNAYTAAGAGWTLDAITPNGFADLAEHQILSSNAAIAATGTASGTPPTQMFCATFMAGGGVIVPVFNYVKRNTLIRRPWR